MRSNTDRKPSRLAPVLAALGTILVVFILVGTMLPVAYICYWMEHTWGGVLYYIGLFLVIYLVIWLIQYLMIRKKINKINMKLGEK